MTEDIANKIEDFFSQFRARHYSKGQILILNGEKTDYVYHLLKGSVKQYDVTYRGDEVILNIFHPPAFFPMSNAINKKNSPYIFEAETDIDVRQVPADNVVDFIRNNPDVMFDLLSRVYRGTDELLSRMALLMADNARNRVIFELALEARRSGEIQEDGSCALAVNEKDLGSRAGLSRETVSREIKKLKDEKLIIVEGKHIHIVDMSRLVDKMRHEP